MNQLEHVRLHSLVGDAMWHFFHVVKEGSVHELKHQVQLAISSEALQEGHQVLVVQGLQSFQLSCSGASDLHKRTRVLRNRALAQAQLDEIS